MFKSTLGLGLGSTKKSDLNQYLKTLEKKNKEVQRRFSVTETDVKIIKTDDGGGESVKADTEEDSDLLSIQKEFEDEFDSPYIKKKDDRRPSAVDEIPSEVPFISSLAAPRSSSGAGAGAALTSFMKYDRKWRGGKEGAKVSVKIESDTESEPVITDNSAPLKIAEELEGKIFPQRRRRKSSGSTSLAKQGLSPSPRSKSAKSEGRSRLKLSVGGLSGRNRNISNESQPTPIPTMSEMSEPFLSPRSPLMDILNVRDISEVIDEVIEDVDVDKGQAESDQEESVGRRLSDLIIDNIELQRVVVPEQRNVPERKQEKESNPFHFNSTKLKSFDKSDSEPKKAAKKPSESNKKRNEIMDSISNSVIDDPIEVEDNRQDESSDEETLKEEVQEKKPRRKWNLDPPEASQPPVFNFARPSLPQESSFESSCYYCRNVCARHQSLIMTEHQDQGRPVHVTDLGRSGPRETVKKQPPSQDVGVQVGKSTIHHYLFDPTEDAVFDDTFYQPRYSGLGLSEGRMDLATGSIIDLMKRQLEMAEHQMRSQKTLYRSFCKSLEKSQQRKTEQEGGEEKVLFGRSKRPEKLTFEEALRQVKEEMKQQKRELRSMSKSVSKKKSRGDKSAKSSKESGQHEPSIIQSELSIQSISENIENYENDFEDEESEIHTETFNSKATST